VKTTTAATSGSRAFSSLRIRTLCLIGALGATACQAELGAGGATANGDIDDSIGDGAPGNLPQVGGVVVDPKACDAGLNVTFGGLKRVTKPQYNRMVRDLLGDERDLSQDFGFDSKLGNFSVNLDVVSEIQVEQYFQVAEEAAVEAVANQDRWLICGAGQAEDACVRDAIATLGRRAYRRPLEAREVEGLFEIYAAAKLGDGYSNGLKVLLEALLTSPEFLYHFEFGVPQPGDEQIAPLSNLEMASRLAQFLWQSIPDDELMDSAEQGGLSTVEGIRTQAERMLSDVKARQVIGLFHQQWLRLGETTELDGEETASASAIEDTLRTVESVVIDDQGSLSDLLTVSYGFLDETTKELYGVHSSPIAQGTDGYDKYALNPDERGGILARAGFLGSNSPPSGRGKLIREQLLCGIIPPPPPNVDTSLPEVEPGTPPRAQWEIHVENPGCGACHRLMDPLGFAFDHYDHEGAWRDTVGDGMWPVEDDGEIVSTTDIDGAFVGGQELQARLSESVDVRACVTYQWIRFATGRNPGEEDACSISVASESFQNSDFSIRELLLSVTATDAFRFRRTEGVAQ